MLQDQFNFIVDQISKLSDEAKQNSETLNHILEQQDEILKEIAENNELLRKLTKNGVAHF